MVNEANWQAFIAVVQYSTDSRFKITSRYHGMAWHGMAWHGLDGGVWRNKCEIPFNEAILVGRVRRSAGRIQPCEMICGPLPLFIPLLSSYLVVGMIIMYHSSLVTHHS
jgi:hypothetical protein